MTPTIAAVGAAYVLGVVSLALAGFSGATDPAAAPFGVVIGIFSALAWALSTLSNPAWNARLNLFAALFAAGAVGLSAPIEKICGQHLLTFLCRWPGAGASKVTQPPLYLADEPGAAHPLAFPPGLSGLRVGISPCAKR